MIAQDEREVRERERLIRQHAGPATDELCAASSIKRSCLKYETFCRFEAAVVEKKIAEEKWFASLQRVCDYRPRFGYLIKRDDSTPPLFG